MKFMSGEMLCKAQLPVAAARLPSFQVDDNGVEGSNFGIRRLQTKGPELIEELLKVNDGVYLGEPHGNKNVTDMVVRQLERQGTKVAAIYIETFPNTAESRNVLQRYQRGDIGDRELDHYFRGYTLPVGATKETWNGYTSIVKCAKAKGIRLVPIDLQRPSNARDIPGDHTGNRMRSSNASWVEEINADRRQNASGKYLVFGGSVHGENDSNQRFGTPSVAEMLRIPSVAIGPVPGGSEAGEAFIGDSRYDYNIHTPPFARPPAFGVEVSRPSFKKMTDVEALRVLASNFEIFRDLPPEAMHQGTTNIIGSDLPAMERKPSGPAVTRAHLKLMANAAADSKFRQAANHLLACPALQLELDAGLTRSAVEAMIMRIK